MLRKLTKRIYGGQKGITGLETAIILIAFVVVAAVFAYTVLSAGLFSTQKSQQAVYSGIKQTESTLEIKGDVIANGTPGAPGNVDSLTFALTPVTGGELVDFTLPTANTVVISYTDSTQKVQNLDWTKAYIGKNNGDDMLNPGEKFQITVNFDTGPGLTNALGPNTTFTVELKTDQGAVLSFQRTTPPIIDKIMDLH